MILFPIALLWLIAVIVWVVRNEGSPSTPEFVRRWLPRRPDGPQRGRPTGTPDRRGSVAGRARRAERDTADH
jgi:hypothetical protein